jgi:hypothetical protein
MLLDMLLSSAQECFYVLHTRILDTIVWHEFRQLFAWIYKTTRFHMMDISYQAAPSFWSSFCPQAKGCL